MKIEGLWETLVGLNPFMIISLSELSVQRMRPKRVPSASGQISDRLTLIISFLDSAIAICRFHTDYNIHNLQSKVYN